MKEVYSFSEKVIKQRRQLMIIVTIAILLLVPTMEVSMMGLQEFLASGILIKITAGILVFITIEVIVVGYVMLKKVKKMQLTVNEDAIIRSGGKKDEVISFDQITSMKVVRNPKDEIVMIKLKLGKKPVIIWGVEDLDSIEAVLEEKVSNVDSISKKKWKVDWNSPLMTVVLIFVMSSVMILIMKQDGNVGKIVNAFISIGLGVYFIFFKPLSKASGKRFRAFELIVGIIIVLGQVISLLDI